MYLYNIKVNTLLCFRFLLTDIACVTEVTRVTVTTVRRTRSRTRSVNTWIWCTWIRNCREIYSMVELHVHVCSGMPKKPYIIRAHIHGFGFHGFTNAEKYMEYFYRYS